VACRCRSEAGACLSLVTIVVGAVPRLAAMREKLEALAGLDRDRIARLALYADAVSAANAAICPLLRWEGLARA
jgi:hypothetical protein